MNIIGINFGHDASACLLVNGKIINAIEEEKMSRIKQDNGWPEHAINAILSANGLKPSDIDIVAFGANFFQELGRNEIRYRFTEKKTYKNREILDRVLAYYGLGKKQIGPQNRSVFDEQLKEKGFSRAKVVFYNHHLAHAYSAYYAAPFEAEVIITADGVGGEESFNYYTFVPGKGIQMLKMGDYRISIGQFYSAITKLLGFRPTRHEGKITGLAAYGKPTELVEKFMALYYYEGENLMRFPEGKQDELWKKYNLDSKLSLSQKINLKTSEWDTAVAYSKNARILQAWIEEVTKGHSKEDIAYACQNVTERVMVMETDRILKKHFSGKKVKVVLAGGVFANVRVNQKIYEMDQVEEIFIQPAMGDPGLAMGAAIMADMEFNKRPVDANQYRFTDTYIGPDFTNTVENFVKNISSDFTVEKMAEPAKKVAELMRDNVIVGFWHGSMEWGPRALGRRSMILNTFDKSVNDTLNKRLNRTEFMPFAPSVIDYMAQTYMPKYDGKCPAADYMTITYDVDPKYHEQLQAVVHVDGTARPQIVRKETNPYYYDIIDEFYKLTGCGAIVNTSFNVHEEPIVSTPEVAFKALRDDRIDALVVDDYLLLKKK